ncbi:hypothetical protein LCGC14_2636960, partial [marine sediment metagenome]
LTSPAVNQPIITWDTSSIIGIPTFDTLTSSRASTTTVDINATYLILFDNVNFTTQKYDTVNLTINSATSGANGLDTGVYAATTYYANWVIGKTDGTEAGLHSLSFSAPTIPAGFTLKKLVGATFCVSISPVVFKNYQQVDNWIAIAETAVLNTSSPTSGAIDISSAVPTIAKIAGGWLDGRIGGGNVTVTVASDVGTTLGVSRLKSTNVIGHGSAVGTQHTIAFIMPITLSQTIHYSTVNADFVAVDITSFYINL